MATGNTEQSANAEFVYGRYRRSQLIIELSRLRDLGENRADAASQFIGGECRVAGLATARAYQGIRRNDAISTVLYLRLVTETALRIAWLADDDGGKADAKGRPLVDASRLRTRTRMLTKRDLMHLRASFVAIHDPEDDDRDKLADQLNELVDATRSRQPRELRKTWPPQGRGAMPMPGIVFARRWCIRALR